MFFVRQAGQIRSQRVPLTHTASRLFSTVDVDELYHFGKKKQTSVTLRALMETGVGKKLDEYYEQTDFKQETYAGASDRVKVQIACFLHRELPIRLAHRALQLEGFPLFQNNKYIMGIASWYRMSFAALRMCPAPTDPAKEKIFRKAVADIYERHSHTLVTMAMGAQQIRNDLGKNISEFADISDVQAKLNDFYSSRIGIRMLIGQYLALQSGTDDPDMIGLISRRVSIKNVAQQAIDDARYMCSRTHGDAPAVTIHGRTDLTFAYVPSHIQYILLELLKNSLRATVETHGVDKMPAVRIIIADSPSNEDVVIKVSDEGGGISRSNMPKIWSYLFTTANPAVLEALLNDNSSVDFTTATPLAGLGYGIPISRIYARYFGGELDMRSMEGYGTDCFVYLPKLKESVLM
jgi:pyruvate dehydrogenase kinase 2/3/4